MENCNRHLDQLDYIWKEFSPQSQDRENLSFATGGTPLPNWNIVTGRVKLRKNSDTT